MSQANAKEIPLSPLLENCSFADEITEPQPWPLLPIDFKGLVENCQGLNFQCDSEIHRLHVISGKGGFHDGNLCYVEGLLFTDGKDEPVSRIRFDYNKEHMLVILVRSLVSSFQWHYRVDEPETKQSTSTPTSTKAGGCFVATAAYGSPFAPEVLVFQRFRDEVLLTSRLGRLFVATYYLVSPPLASLISRADILKRATRHFVLMPILRLLKIRNKH